MLVGTSTIATWCKNIMEKPGIDIETYSLHSMRFASKSKAKLKGLSMAEINRAAGWSVNLTLRKFYEKQIYNYGNSFFLG